MAGSDNRPSLLSTIMNVRAEMSLNKLMERSALVFSLLFRKQSHVFYQLILLVYFLSVCIYFNLHF